MTTQERLQAMRAIMDEEIIPLTEAKAHDYSGNEDTFSNLRDFGWNGVVVRIGDKYHRLKNFTKQQKCMVANETVEDTLIDLINYGMIALMMFRDESSASECKDDRPRKRK